jgi:hypothetical protein
MRPQLVVVVLLSLLAGLQWSCSDEEQRPQARLFFAHQIYTLGPLEVLVDGRRIATVESNTLDLSVVRSIDAGQRVLAIRAQGATQVLEERTVDFDESTYLIGFDQDFDGGNVNVRVFGAGEPASIGSERAAVSVVNYLSEQASGEARRGIPVDVYLNAVLIAESLEYGASSPYLDVPAAEPSVVQVFPAGSSISDTPLLMANESQLDFFNAKASKAIVLALHNTRPQMGSSPRVQIGAFALR